MKSNSIQNKILSTFLSTLMVYASIFPYAHSQSNDKREVVDNKKGKVEENQKIDNDDAEPSQPNKLMKVEDDLFFIQTKIFEPPEKRKFKAFPSGKYADIQLDPSAMPARFDLNTETEIQFNTIIDVSKASIFPLQGEGNLKPINSGKGGRGIFEEYWAKKIFAANFKILSEETDDLSDAVLEMDDNSVAAPKDSIQDVNFVPTDFNQNISALITAGGAGNIKKYFPKLQVEAVIPDFVEEVKVVESKEEANDKNPKIVYAWTENTGVREAKVINQELLEAHKEGVKIVSAELEMPADSLAYSSKLVYGIWLNEEDTEITTVNSSVYQLHAGKPANVKVQAGDSGTSYTLWSNYKKLEHANLNLGKLVPNTDFEIKLNFEITDLYGHPVNGTPAGFNYAATEESLFTRINNIWNGTRRAGISQNESDFIVSGGKASLVLKSDSSVNDEEVFLNYKFGDLEGSFGDPKVAMKITGDIINFPRESNLGAVKVTVLDGNDEPLPVGTPIKIVGTKGSLSSDAWNWKYGFLNGKLVAGGNFTFYFSNEYFGEDGQPDPFIQKALGKFTFKAIVGGASNTVIKDTFRLPEKELPVLFINDPVYISNLGLDKSVKVPRISINKDDDNKQATFVEEEAINYSENGVIRVVNSKEKRGLMHVRVMATSNDELADTDDTDDKEASYITKEWEIGQGNTGANESQLSRTDKLFDSSYNAEHDDLEAFPRRVGNKRLNFTPEKIIFSPQRTVRSEGIEKYQGIFEDSQSFSVYWLENRRPGALSGHSVAMVNYTDNTDPSSGGGSTVTNCLQGMRIAISLPRINRNTTRKTVLFEVKKGDFKGRRLRTVLRRQLLLPDYNVNHVYKFLWRYVPVFDAETGKKIQIRYEFYVKNMTTNNELGAKSNISIADGDLEEYPLPSYLFNTDRINIFLEGAIANPKHAFNEGIYANFVNAGRKSNGFPFFPSTTADVKFGLGPETQEYKSNFQYEEFVSPIAEFKTDDGKHLISYENTSPINDPNLINDESILRNIKLKARARGNDCTVSVVTQTYPITSKQVIGQIGGFFKGAFWEQDDRFSSSEVGEFLGSMLAVGDIGRILKNVARMIADNPDNPADIMELAFSAFGVVMVLLPAVGQGIKQVGKTIMKEMALKSLAIGVTANLTLSYIFEKVAIVLIGGLFVLVDEYEPRFDLGDEKLPLTY